MPIYLDEVVMIIGGCVFVAGMITLFFFLPVGIPVCVIGGLAMIGAVIKILCSTHTDSD